MPMWSFCNQAVQFIFIIALAGFENPAAVHLSRLDLAPTNRVTLKMIDSIRILHIKIDVASETPKQYDNEKNFHPDAIPSSDSAATEPKR